MQAEKTDAQRCREKFIRWIKIVKGQSIINSCPWRLLWTKCIHNCSANWPKILAFIECYHAHDAEFIDAWAIINIYRCFFHDSIWSPSYYLRWFCISSIEWTQHTQSKLQFCMLLACQFGIHFCSNFTRSQEKCEMHCIFLTFHTLTHTSSSDFWWIKASIKFDYKNTVAHTNLCLFSRCSNTD